MTMIRFENDQQRGEFRMRMALVALQGEATSKFGLRVCRVNVIQVLREYFPNLPRTRKSAYKYLIKKGYYNGERN
jgi:hypothetical protein|tara:strand:- start:416 stop:640 length:225 start_codon:yes stop_codon:yes gene_type:complete